MTGPSSVLIGTNPGSRLACDTDPLCGSRGSDHGSGPCDGRDSDGVRISGSRSNTVSSVPWAGGSGHSVVEGLPCA